MLARGLQTKQVARALGISAKTADRHIQNAYRKIGVSSRAAATLFAMEHGLVAWGELPIAAPGARSVASISTQRNASEGGPHGHRHRLPRKRFTRSRRRSHPRWERRRAEVEEVVDAGPGVDAARASPASGRHACSSSRPGSATPASRRPRSSARRGRLITTDFSPAMLAAARRRGAELGVANVDYRVMDAERIELDDDSVDGVLCRFGYMLMADPAAALAETRRVLARAVGWRSRSGARWSETRSSRSSGSASSNAGTSRRPSRRPRRGRSAWRARSTPKGSCEAPASPRCAPRRCPGASWSRT